MSNSNDIKKKSVIIHCENAFRMFKQDEFDSFRAEGRYPINIGFGLSRLGFDVNMIFDGWDSIKGYKETWNGIKLSKNPLKEYYDYSLIFTGPAAISKSKFGKGIYMGYQSEHIQYASTFKKLSGRDLLFACPFKYMIDIVRSAAPFPVYYLPPLYPIQSINQDFFPCTFTPKNEIKLYLHYSSWPQNQTISGDRFTTKEQLILDYLKSIGANVKLTIQIENRNISKSFSGFDTTFFYSNEHNYYDVIQLIRSSDLCITQGAPAFAGNSLNDIISLGKPLIYIGDGKPNGRCPNPMYNFQDDIIYIQESHDETVKKLSRFISNPVHYGNKFASVFQDYNFNIWKEHARQIFLS